MRTKTEKITKLILFIAWQEMGTKPFTSDQMYNIIIRRNYIANPDYKVKRKTVKDLCSRLAREGSLRRINDIFISKPTMGLAELVERVTQIFELHGDIPVYYTGKEQEIFSAHAGINKFIII